ncbi:MAG: GNAT family N-acetyltransferase [Acidocella sp.]|nr:GNAT family N-acetyltransferase [Acidocella sp.]
MIAIRRARLSDAAGIAAVHVATWRNAYANVLPEAFLAGLSSSRLAGYYEHGIRLGLGLHVAAAYGNGTQPAILGFSSACRSRNKTLAEGEVETLYVLDDYRDQGLGGQLLRASAKHLAQLGCRSAYAWVLRDNPARYFYTRMGGKHIASGTTIVGGEDIPQTAFAWDPIETLLDVNA